MDVVYVRMACARKGHHARARASQVSRSNLIVFSFLWLTFGRYSLLAADNQAHFRTFVLTSVAGIFSLFPLLFTPAGKMKFALYLLGNF